MIRAKEIKRKKQTARRMTAILLIFAISATLLSSRLFMLAIIKHGYYSDKAYDQITTSAPLRAERGKIYDSSMNLLACESTVWRVFISPRDVRSATKKDGVDYAELISKELSTILSLDRVLLKKKITSAKTLDVTVKRSVSANEYEAVLKLIREKSLEGLILTEAQTSRFYPEGRLAAHLLGFTGSDNQGLYGLEYYYDKVLSGKDGYYLYAKDANGKTLTGEYSDYEPAINGLSLVTTIDSYVQRALETQLESIRINHKVENRVTGIVMDTESGAILAMATSSPFDPNFPYELDTHSTSKLLHSGYAPGSEEYKKLKTELMQIMWSNKAVSEIYEPGSTFKIITVSAALDSGAVKTSDTFSCKGFHEVGGWRIKCHKVTGHGSGFSLAYGLQMSCNPTMMKIAEKIGAETFYDYVTRFGYLKKTGIDLPSEASAIFHAESAIGPTELATASFGQRFKVSAIAQLTAIAAVANGGVSVTPYVVERIIDDKGNVITEHEHSSGNRIISEEVARTVSTILEEGVSGDGGAKNAAVGGYKIAAKTGTSQKFDVLDANGNSYLRIGSTVAYAPSDDAGIAVIIVVDEPTTAVKYGSVVAAPYVAGLFERVLPYLEYKADGESPCIKLDSYVGKSAADAKEEISKLGIPVEIIGGGTEIIEQSPPGGAIIDPRIGRVFLYTSGDQNGYVTVPDLRGYSAYDANLVAASLGITPMFKSDHAPDSGSIIISQSPAPGEKVKKGTIIRLYAVYRDFED